jgi:hypothetical protein
MPAVFATSVGSSLGVDVTTEDFAPMVWMCDSRTVYDDNVQGWRTSDGGDELVERINNYAFEGEQIEWEVLVMDKNGINKLEDVFATIGGTQGEGNDIEVNCVEDPEFSPIVEDTCNARILEEDLTGEDIDPATQRYYTCTFTVETPDSMYGEYWITVEAVDLDGLSGTMDENEYWFLNPVIALSIDGDLTFENVRPGALSYSDTLLVQNDADDSSGVLLDMFISGTDFYDSSSSGAMCPTTNQLALTNFRYFATHGAYSTQDDDEVDDGDYDPATVRDRDTEGYVNIQYGDTFERAVYDEAEIIQDGAPGVAGFGWRGNLLSPGAEMAITFKLSLPEPCNGDFDSGDIFFWGEAV